MNPDFLLGLGLGLLAALVVATAEIIVYRWTLTVDARMARPQRIRGRDYFVVAERDYHAMREARDVLRIALAGRKASDVAAQRYGATMAERDLATKSRGGPEHDLSTHGSPLKPGT